MNIPLDNLYHWIAGLCSQPATIYYFWPHGSKKLKDMQYFSLGSEFYSHKYEFGVVCYDQEPLDFDYYELYSAERYFQEKPNEPFIPYRQAFLSANNVKNFELVVQDISSGLYDNIILIHSEKNSRDLEKYQAAGYIPVHYWCHGIIARDWFRFAEHDPRLQIPRKSDIDFLIYCRDWSGTREYRLKFLEHLNQHNLSTCCKVYFNPVNGQGIHYKNFKPANDAFQLESDTVFDYPLSNVAASASADYDVNDHVTTSISVVLETNFDGSRIQLTEKICRAIVCEHPFLLACGPCSLQYLRDYGFETFDPWIDESYDQELNSAKRLELIVQAMKKFSDQSAEQKHQALIAMSEIAKRNKQRFFSEEFYKLIVDELQMGLHQAFVEASKSMGNKMIQRRRLWKKKKWKGDIPKRYRIGDYRSLLLARRFRQSHNGLDHGS